MKFSTGVFDALFGEKMMMQVRQDDGSLKDVRVTKAWWQEMQNEGAMTVSDIPSGTVHLHIVGPDGLQHGSLKVGIDIPEDRYKRLVDSQTGALYAIQLYEAGVPKLTIVTRELWEQAKEAMDAA